MRKDISYTYQETPRGGIVRIATANADARAAVHRFLTYQITEHKTGDLLPDDATPMPEHSPQAGAQAMPMLQGEPVGCDWALGWR